MGSNNLVRCIFLGSVWNCIRFFFSSVFFCVVPMQKINKHVNTKTFSKKCRVAFSNRNYKGSNIFGHDCIWKYTD